MIKPKIILTLLALIFALNSGCRKEDPVLPPADNKPLSFISLTVEDNTIEAGSNTAVKAVAFGYDLTYHWSTSVGAILKSGYEGHSKSDFNQINNACYNYSGSILAYGLFQKLTLETEWGYYLDKTFHYNLTPVYTLTGSGFTNTVVSSKF